MDAGTRATESYDHKNRRGDEQYRKDETDYLEREGREMFTVAPDGTVVVDKIPEEDEYDWWPYYADEPSDEEIRQAEEAREAKERRFEASRKQFYADRGNTGLRRVHGRLKK